MTSPVITIDRLRTLARAPFDPETISITVGYKPDTDQLRLVIRDEISKAQQELKFNSDCTEEQAARLIVGAALDLGLKEGPDRLAD